jgi:hypothetical protein
VDYEAKAAEVTGLARIAGEEWASERASERARARARAMRFMARR